MNQSNLLPAFKQALQQGSGQCFQLLQQLSNDELVSALHPACLHDFRYDKGDENDPVNWLLRLLEKTESDSVMLPKLLEALPQSGNEYDHYIRYALAMGIAIRQGNHEAQNTLLSYYDSRSDAQACLLHQALLRQRGLEGLSRVASKAGKALKANETVYVGEHMNVYSEACRYLGAAQVQSYLGRQATRQVAIFTYLELIESAKHKLKTIQAEVKAKHTPDVTQQDVDEIMSNLTAQDHRARITALRFSKHASEEQRMAIFLQMRQLSQEDTLSICFSCFRERGFPRLSGWLFQWLKVGQTSTRRNLCLSLRHHRHPSIRNHALELLAQPNAEPLSHALLLLQNNYVQGDGSLIEQRLFSPERDRGEIELLAQAVIPLYEKYPDDDYLGSIMISLLDRCPNSCTRAQIYHALQDHDQLSDTLTERWRYDLSNCAPDYGKAYQQQRQAKAVK